MNYQEINDKVIDLECALKYTSGSISRIEEKLIDNKYSFNIVSFVTFILGLICGFLIMGVFA